MLINKYQMCHRQGPDLMTYKYRKMIIKLQKINKKDLKWLKNSKNYIQINFLCQVYGMEVQNTFISINESAPIRNLTLFGIVAVDNHQLAQIIES